jgi:hypothetical protein
MIEHEKNGTCDLTFGCTDPLQAGVMAKHQQVFLITAPISQAPEADINGFCRQYTSPVLCVATLKSVNQEWIMQTTPGTPYQL